MNAPQTFPANLPALIDALPADATRAPQTEFTRQRQAAFLAALAESGSARSAAKACAVSRQTVYRVRRADAAFRRGWDAALLAARVHAEEVLATRALDGVEEEVWYHGEIVATRRRYDSRLLLAHLARLDRLTANAEVNRFAEDFEAALERFAQGSDAPEAAPEAEDRKKDPGQCHTCHTSPAEPASRRASVFPPCPECGGACEDPDAELDPTDCQWIGNRLDRMDAARPPGAKEPHEFPGYDGDAVEAEQMAAFEAGIDRWWLAVPPADDSDAEWAFAEE